MRITLATLLLLLSSGVLAGSVSGTLITRLMVDRSQGERIFIRIDGAVANSPSCNTNGTWQFVLPLTTEFEKDTITSLLLSAHMANKKVRLDGNNTCDSFSSIETLKRVEFVE